MRSPARLQTRLYRLQHRLALTTAEGTVLFVIAAALALGVAVRGAQATREARPAAELYASDARFAALDRAADTAGVGGSAVGGAEGVAPPTAPALLDGAAEGAGTAAPAADAAATGLVNLNTASAHELERLPRIGPALAARIVAYREANGPFRSVQDIERVHGIGPRTREQLAPFVVL